MEPSELTTKCTKVTMEDGAVATPDVSMEGRIGARCVSDRRSSRFSRRFECMW
jgi:hypothetical protein